MSLTNTSILTRIQAIVNIVAGTASLTQEYEVTVYTQCTCSNCATSFYKLTANKAKYLALYPHCARCGHETLSNEVSEDHDAIGAEAIFLQRGGEALASFKITRKALDATNIKETLNMCGVKRLT